VGFRADVTFSTIQNMYFFINDTTTELQNTFDVEYDDIDLIQYHGELNIEPSALWNLKAGFNYYSYSTLLLDKPWHKPQYDLTLNASYNLKEKLVLSGDLIVFGKRYAKSSLFPEGMVKLDPVIDLNLGVDYLFSKLFTLFFNIYNITGRSYMLWNQYPSQRFNFMIGFSYKL
jgi:outer membrane receptor protein involved in Fe transport